MREYIFCSVIESPQIASRSPFFKTSPEGFGALPGLNFSSAGPFAAGSSGWAEANLNVSSPSKNRVLGVILRGDCLKFSLWRQVEPLAGFAQVPSFPRPFAPNPNFFIIANFG